LKAFKDLDKEDQELLLSLKKKDEVEMVECSNITKDGIDDVKNKACDILLSHRVEIKLQKNNSKVESILSRVHLSVPETKDDKERETCIPEEFLMDEKNKKENGDEMETDKILEKDLEREGGGPGVYSMDVKKKYLLKDDDWKYDKIPEIFNGRNISDYVDENIFEKLEKLEKEEEERLKNDIGNIDWESEEFFIPKEVHDDFVEIENKSSIYRQRRKIKSSGNVNKLPQKFKEIPMEEIEEELISRGVEQDILERAKSSTRSASRPKSSSKTRLLSGERSTSELRNLEDSKLREDRNSKSSLLGKRKRTLSSNQRSLSTGKHQGILDPREQIKTIMLGHKKQKLMNLAAKRGEGDRVIHDLKPKHLLTGKRGIGKTERR
jgi:nucleolar GTP-binding protein